MIQTAEGALSETQAIGQRMRELAVQSANGTYTDEDRALINQEFDQLKSEIDRIANDTEFNGNKVLNGNLSGKEITEGTLTKGAGTGDMSGKFTIDQGELAKLGEGNFEFKITVDGAAATANVTIDLIDKSQFNGGKEYVMDSITLDNVDTTQAGSESFKIGGIDIEIDPENLESGATVTFTNTAEKKTDGVSLQVGANKDQMIGVSMDTMKSRELGLGGIGVGTAADAQEAIERLDAAVERVSAQRADLGAAQNRLEHTIASTDNTAENLQAAESRIRDVDMAKEMMNLTKLNVLQQASQSMLAQANQAPQQVLSILR